jgi:gliding motility-associated lipoprotein GldD
MRSSYFSFLSLLLLFAFALSSCEESYTPRPKAYPKVHYPARHYVSMKNQLPYTFDYNAAAVIIPDTNFFGEKPENPYWINVFYPDLDAVIHISYKQISSKNTLNSLLEDAFMLSFKHTVKAEAIDKANLHPTPSIGGQLFKVSGDAASAYQFFLTDSSKNFIRGALYFNCEPNADSLAPVTEYIYEDLTKMLKTFRFK